VIQVLKREVGAHAQLIMLALKAQARALLLIVKEGINVHQEHQILDNSLKIQVITQFQLDRHKYSVQQDTTAHVVLQDRGLVLLAITVLLVLKILETTHVQMENMVRQFN